MLSTLRKLFQASEAVAEVALGAVIGVVMQIDEPELGAAGGNVTSEAVTITNTILRQDLELPESLQIVHNQTSQLLLSRVRACERDLQSTMADRADQLEDFAELVDGEVEVDDDDVDLYLDTTDFNPVEEYDPAVVDDLTTRV